MKPQPEHTFAAWISETSTKQNHSFPFKCIQPNKIIFSGIKWTTTDKQKKEGICKQHIFFPKNGKRTIRLTFATSRKPLHVSSKLTCKRNQKLLTHFLFADITKQQRILMTRYGFHQNYSKADSHGSGYYAVSCNIQI